MAGMGMRDIKRKIRSVNSTKQITKAMELVSTAKLKRTRDRLEITQPYFETVKNTVQDILKNSKDLKHEYLNEREVKKSLYIIITADRGLCGGYNINAIKKAVEDIKSKEDAVIIAIGQKARDYFKKRDYKVVREFVHISEKPEYKHARIIAKEALTLYKEEKVDEVKIIYTKFISTISQEAQILRLLPVDKKDEDEKVEFKFVSYEPSPEAVLDYLVPKYIESTVYGAMVESAASEQAARRIAMENATDNAEEMIDNLTLSFNQARQAAITQEISEIVGGAEALK
ncbi:ATP synthase F1 subcomplex gamma subunit [Caminicella sporogenes DSM 14501]|uniref:ATP synthase gamma chain n=1 Tax=Caminicella sporogenes DSM 14501 TaxID=1121266 RepID=A0A1M6PU02_9FIRM|nr:ATP synthase F1 subunit gamma [Caminicella sporogenes]RKD21975.1 ATP synthase F1 subunit gamma [Caminicella sporogenes]WIF96065.1 ATP synthase F1 subunit gamma [Caminicella sporogenes]SHK11427.1 ATP synthase F1 subcomplex gamma subunit [Caminicella sporogenes DSM 14501]